MALALLQLGCSWGIKGVGTVALLAFGEEDGEVDFFFACGGRPEPSQSKRIAWPR
jgi:hypothetical protein